MPDNRWKDHLEHVVGIVRGSPVSYTACAIVSGFIGGMGFAMLLRPSLQLQRAVVIFITLDSIVLTLLFGYLLVSALRRAGLKGSENGGPKSK
jgi:hypothetical protein